MDLFEKFKQNHKPKIINFAPYLKQPKLKDYTILSDKNVLETRNTYIKFIRAADLFVDKKYAEHIKCGGILLKGQCLKNNVLTGTDVKSKWTHLTLKYDPPAIINDLGVVTRERLEKPLIYVIKISDNHVFYKKSFDTMRNLFRNINELEIELV